MVTADDSGTVPVFVLEYLFTSGAAPVSLTDEEAEDFGARVRVKDLDQDEDAASGE